MPRSFLIANKRYQRKPDKNHNNVSKVVHTEFPEKEYPAVNDMISQEENEDKLREAELQENNNKLSSNNNNNNNSNKFETSVKTLLPRHSIYNSWKVPDLSYHDPDYDISFYPRPLHHIYRYLPPHEIFLPSPTAALPPVCDRRYEAESFDRLNALVEKVFDDIDLCEIFVCDECGKTYSTSSNLARHKQIHRDISDKKARKCPHCEKVYVSMPAFSMHVRTHSQGCVCPYCGKRFSRPWLLQGHIRTHTGEKPFTCPKCAKAFADKSNLRAHIQTHSTEKPYTCGRCGKAFALKSYLSKHEESSCMRGLKYHKLHCAFLPRNA